METTQRDDWTPERLRAVMKKMAAAAKEDDLSAASLAGKIGCHQVTVEAWLRGERKPTGAARRTLERLEAECREREGQS